MARVHRANLVATYNTDYNIFLKREKRRGRDSIVQKQVYPWVGKRIQVRESDQINCDLQPPDEAKHDGNQTNAHACDLSAGASHASLASGGSSSSAATSAGASATAAAASLSASCA